MAAKDLDVWGVEPPGDYGQGKTKAQDAHDSQRMLGVVCLALVVAAVGVGLLAVAVFVL